MRQIINTSDYQEIIDSLLPSEIHTLDRMLETGNRIGWMNALEGIAIIKDYFTPNLNDEKEITLAD